MVPFVPRRNDQGMWAHPRLKAGKMGVRQATGWLGTHSDKWQSHLLPEIAGTTLRKDVTPAPPSTLGWLIP